MSEYEVTFTATPATPEYFAKLFAPSADKAVYQLEFTHEERLRLTRWEQLKRWITRKPWPTVTVHTIIPAAYISETGVEASHE